MRKLSPLLVFVLVLLAVWWLQPGKDKSVQPVAASAVATAPATTEAHESATQALPAFLPAEAHATLALIARGGPYPHRQDDGVFGNRERHLPQKPRGYYREYTVETPGLGHRGARRIITGGQPPLEYYYTDDHYDSFRQFQVPNDRVLQ